MPEKPFNLVYLTTNLVNQKFYVGVHSTYNLDDGYLGSGNNIRNAIKKYGKENFKRDILHLCLTKNDAYELERQIVDNFLLNKENCYNIIKGGNSNRTINTKRTSWNKGLTKYTDERILDYSYKLSKIKKDKLLSPYHKEQIGKSSKGRFVSLDTKEKIRKTKIGELHHNAKSYKVITPNGEIIYFKGLTNFCKNNNLSLDVMYDNTNKGTILKEPFNRFKSEKGKNCIGWTIESNQ